MKQRLLRLALRIAGAITRRCPWILSARINSIVLVRRITYPLRFLPVSSKVLGPPKGYYYSIEEFAEKGGQGGACRLVRLRTGERGVRRMPRTNSAIAAQKFGAELNYEVPPQTVATITQGRFHGKGHGVVITPDDRIVWTLSPTNYSFDLGLHQAFSTLKFPIRRRLKKAVVLHTRCIERNYFHWTLDFLTRFQLLSLAGIDLEGAWFVVNHEGRPYQVEGLRRLGIPEERVIRSSRWLHVEAESLIVPSFMNPRLSASTISYPRSSLEFLRSLYLGRDADRPASGGRRRLYISRERSLRRITNEAELFAQLERRGFEKVVLEDLAVWQQAAIFDSAEMVVGYHGAGLANAVFCRPGSRIVEIFHPDFIMNYYWPVCDMLDLDYVAYCEDGRRRQVTGYRVASRLPATVDVGRFLAFMDSLASS